MAWERRRNGQYYYTKKRVGGKVVSTYHGCGPAAALTELTALTRAEGDRMAEVRAYRRAFRPADRALGRYERMARVATAAVLLATGHHQHRGTWRRMRGVARGPGGPFLDVATLEAALGATRSAAAADAPADASAEAGGDDLSTRSPSSAWASIFHRAPDTPLTTSPTLTTSHTTKPERAMPEPPLHPTGPTTPPEPPTPMPPHDSPSLAPTSLDPNTPDPTSRCTPPWLRPRSEEPAGPGSTPHDFGVVDGPITDMADLFTGRNGRRERRREERREEWGPRPDPEPGASDVARAVAELTGDEALGAEVAALHAEALRLSTWAKERRDTGGERGLHGLFLGSEGLWARMGDVERAVLRSVAQAGTGNHEAARAGLLERAEAFRREIGGPSPPALERPAIGMAVAAYVQREAALFAQAEYVKAQAGRLKLKLELQRTSTEAVAFWGQRVGEAERRLQRALESLARLRKLTRAA